MKGDAAGAKSELCDFIDREMGDIAPRFVAGLCFRGVLSGGRNCGQSIC